MRKSWQVGLVGIVCLLVPALLPAVNAQPSAVQPKFNCDQIADAPAPAAPLVLRRAICELAAKGELDDLRWPGFLQFRNQLWQFYAGTDYAPAWVQQSQLSQQARTMVDLLQHADQKGLRPEDYDGPRWAERIQHLSQQNPKIAEMALARLDLALTVSAMRYLTDLHRGRVNPNDVEFALVRKTFPAHEFLRARVLGAADVRSAVQQAEPSLAGYRRTLQALQSYLELARKGDGDPLPPLSRMVVPGDTYAGAAQLAQRLRSLGDLALDAPPPARPGIYEGTLVQAVRHFQLRHGLAGDGRIGPETYHQLTVPLSHRVAQLQLTLERWRWLPDSLQRQLVAVNIPEFRLRAYEDHKEVLSMKVVVGKSFDHQTPVFADDMEYVIFRPYWNVPTSIVKNEIVPLLRRNPRYLTTHHMELVNHHGEIVPAETASRDLIRQLQAGNLELRQQPGPWNSVGLLKFVLPNQYSVYLHGTPEQRLFQRARRDFSHGCIRVEDPAALGVWVLRDSTGWPLTRVRETMYGNETVQVNLKRTIPVLVLYGTAVVQENGEINFFEDIYSLDAALQRALDGVHP